MSATSFAVECLNVWVPPLLGGAGASPVTLESLLELIDDDSRLDASKDQIPAVVVSFDMNEQREVSVCLSGPRADGLLHLDFVGRFTGSTAAMEALRKLTDTDRQDLDVAAVVSDGSPANMDLIHRLEHEYILATRQKQELENASQVGVKAAGAAARPDRGTAVPASWPAGAARRGARRRNQAARGRLGCSTVRSRGATCAR